MILTPQARKSLERGLATVNALEDKLLYLEQIAAVSPQFADRIAQLRTRKEYQKTLATVAITADSSTRQ
jgi:hypothetical protein